MSAFFHDTDELSKASPSHPKRRKVRIVCVSDTHNHAPSEGYTLPKGDVLIHAGDLTNQGSKGELEKAARWLEKADFAVKIVVAGNHDLSLDPKYQLKHEQGWRVTGDDVSECRALMDSIPGVTYLQHSAADVCLPDHGFSIRVFGSPFSVAGQTQNWAFQYAPEEAAALWAEIPEDIDVMVIHTPPAGRLDASDHWRNGGCPSLADMSRKIRPALHVCGHCHEGRGAEIIQRSIGPEHSEETLPWQDPGAGSKKQSLLDLVGLERESPAGVAATVNASIMAKSWGRGPKTFNKPIVVDVLLPRRDS